ncbi:hypothetical protein AERO8C_160120 [Aeromonas veronii]|uniref:Uncharacterized protein n=1 Tax=Aeromonas veronii TaxID=654 RepID=A0A653KXW6_AERVE|nr:hypothetical protein AERO8C_160120 [Aeromonas veronii]
MSGACRCLKKETSRPKTQARFERGGPAAEWGQEKSHFWLVDHQFAIFDRNGGARGLLHADHPLLTCEAIGHVITYGVDARILHGLAALLGGGVGIARLHIALHLITGITTRDSPGCGGHLLAAAAAKLVANHATQRRANHGAEDLVLILYRLAMGHGDVATLLSGSLDALGDRLAGDHLGKGGLGCKEGATGRRRECQGRGDANTDTCHHGSVHLVLLLHTHTGSSNLAPSCHNRLAGQGEGDGSATGAGKVKK